MKREDVQAEKTSDVSDAASNLEMMETSFRVEQARNKKADQVKGADGWPITECVDCDIDIPPARLEATGTIRCVVCQSKLEHRR